MLLTATFLITASAPTLAAPPPVVAPRTDPTPTILPTPIERPFLPPVIPVIWAPARERIAIDPPETVADAMAWARATLSPADYQGLYWIVWHESHWRPDALSPWSGACGLAQFWPCHKMSNTLPDWRLMPLEQLRDYLIPYAVKKYGSLSNAWAYWQRHGRW